MLSGLSSVSSIFFGILQQPLDRFPMIVMLLAFNNNLRNEWVTSQPTEQALRERKLHVPFLAVDKLVTVPQGSILRSRTASQVGTGR